MDVAVFLAMPWRVPNGVEGNRAPEAFLKFCFISPKQLAFLTAVVGETKHLLTGWLPTHMPFPMNYCYIS